MPNQPLVAPPGLHDAIARPTYSREALKSSIVHFGVGGFHRAHQAMYLDRILEAGNRDWAICGVGTRPSDARMRDAMKAQDGLYTLVTDAPDGSHETRVIGSIVDYLFAPDGPDAVIDKLADATTRIVSLTITEGGYSIDDATGAFAPHDADVLADLANPDRPPQSALGLIVAGLARRKAAAMMPFTVMSCDNLPGNGDLARTAIAGFAARHDPELAAWIEQEVAFPNAMVDRITPTMTPDHRSAINRETGWDDQVPVAAEAFAQWVLEDRFPGGRPPLETVGVMLVDDIVPFELMKLRLLNASHQVMSHLGILAGFSHVDEVCKLPLFARFLRDYLQREAMPTLPPVPGIDLDRYCETLLQRFGNTAIRDTLARQTVDASDRIPKFLLPVIRDQLQRPEPHMRRAVLTLAAWSLFLENTAPLRHTTPVEDRHRAELDAAIEAEKANPGSFLDNRTVFGDLGSHDVLRTAFIEARRKLLHDGPVKVMRAINDGNV